MIFLGVKAGVTLASTQQAKWWQRLVHEKGINLELTLQNIVKSTVLTAAVTATARCFLFTLDIASQGDFAKATALINSRGLVLNPYFYPSPSSELF